MNESRVPGPKAKRTGTQIKNGRAVQTVCYPRAHAKAVLSLYAEKSDQALSSFLVIAGLEKAAKMKSVATGKPHLAQDLVPEEEYAELLRKRGGKPK